jgi:hypothetical protein
VTFAPLHLPWFADLTVLLGAPWIGMLVAAYAYKIMRAADLESEQRQYEYQLKLVETLGSIGALDYTHEREHGRENVEFRRAQADGLEITGSLVRGRSEAGHDSDEHAQSDPAPGGAENASPDRPARRDRHEGTPDPPRRDRHEGTPERPGRSRRRDHP